jgi:hypothetical protein
MKQLFDSTNKLIKKLDNIPNLITLKVLKNYGKYYQGNFYIPNKDNIKQSKDYPDLFNQYFVVNAFESLMKELKQKVAIGHIAKSSIFNPKNISIIKGFSNPSLLYSNFLFFDYNDFSIKNKLLNSKEYFSNSLNYFLQNNNKIFTFDGYVESSYFDVFNAGLAIKIYDFEINNEEISKYISDNGFKYFNNLCMKHNFFMLKECPWILIYKLDINYNFKDYINCSSIFLSLLDDIFKKIWNKYVITNSALNNLNTEFQINMRELEQFILKKRIQEKNFPVDVLLSDINIVFERLGLQGALRFINLVKIKNDPLFQDRQSILL